MYKYNRWVIDLDNIVSDRLHGYDPYEEPGSPYAYGCTSIMDKIDSISKEEFKNKKKEIDEKNNYINYLCD